MDKSSFLGERLNAPNQQTIGVTKQASTTSLQKEKELGVRSGINAYAGTFGENEIIHLLKRTMFGSRKSDVDFFKGKTVSQAVDALLNIPGTVATAPVKNYSPSSTTTPANDPDWQLAAGQPWVNVFTTDGSVNSSRIASYKAWWIGLMISQDRNIQEKMVLFWHNHFSTETNDVNIAIGCYKHNVLLRKYALGNFRQMVKEITLDPAMLRYLNGYVNSKNAPDENYGRELQELFTVGKGSGSKYTEDDVKQAAKVLTGYRIKTADITSYFEPTLHDTGNKTFSAFYGNKIITGKTGADGAKELDEMLDMILAQDEVAKHIVRKLYRWFVYYNIDAQVEADVITPLANLLRQGNYEIKPVMAALLKSEHFFDTLNQGCQIKSPLDLVVGSVREYNTVFPADTDWQNNYYMWSYLQTIASNQQQNLGDPPDVSGWKAYYQEPQFYEIWINSDTLPKRNQFTDLMITSGYTRNSKTILFDAIAFAKQLPAPADPNKLIDDSLKYLYRIAMSDTTKAQIKKDILLSGQSQDHYWTDAWNIYLATPTDANALATVRNRLRSFYQYLMNLAEYQLA
jgi:uncharacterized protein (DUF1800 family)